MDGKDQYLSPLNHELSTKVPIFMQCGTVEVLYDEQISFFRRMKEVAGNKFEILELENAPHDTFLLGFAKEAEDATLVARDFVAGQKL